MDAVREALEALGHPAGALPEPGRLAELFARFQAQVPLRSAPDGRGAQACLAAWLEEGEGCCGERRVEAFAALAAAAGFDLERLEARDPDGPVRHVLLGDRRRLLLDAAFPLPSPLSLDPPATAEATGYGTLAVRPVGREAFEVRLETRGEERTLYRVEGRPAGAEAPGPPVARAETGGGEPGPRRPRVGTGGLFRLLDDRLLRWDEGVLEVSDAWSRLRVPFPAADTEGLEALFGPPLPEAPPRRTEASTPVVPTLAAYHVSTEEPDRLVRLLADPETHAVLLPDGWSAERLAGTGDGFVRTVVEDGALLRRERFRPLPDGLVVETDGDGPLALFRTRTWRLRPGRGGTRLRLLATLRDPVPPRGLPEGSRRRLVFELASELLALDRFAAER